MNLHLATRVKVNKWTVTYILGEEEISFLQKNDIDYIDHSRTDLMLRGSWSTNSGLYSFCVYGFNWLQFDGVFYYLFFLYIILVDVFCFLTLGCLMVVLGLWFVFWERT